MAIHHYTEATVGLPNSGRIAGVNGDLVTQLDYMLPLNGWAIEYTTGNARIYRPGTGNRFRLYVNDDSSVSGDARIATVRGCENASAASNAGLVDPFPLAAQVTDANSTWIKSSTANTTARAFHILVAETWIIFAVNFNGTAGYWELHFFGDIAPSLSGDSYNTLVSVRGSSNFFAVLWTGGGGWLANSTTVGTGMYMCRSYDGTVKSTRVGKPFILGQSSLGRPFSAGPQAFNGPSTGIDTTKVSIYDSGVQSGAISASQAMFTRGWLPNVLEPMCNGTQATTPVTGDIYHVSAQPTFDGLIITASSGVNSAFLVLQLSDDWVPPNG